MFEPDLVYPAGFQVFHVTGKHPRDLGDQIFLIETAAFKETIISFIDRYIKNFSQFLFRIFESFC
jgi:hypothetical protein